MGHSSSRSRSDQPPLEWLRAQRENSDGLLVEWGWGTSVDRRFQHQQSVSSSHLLLVGRDAVRTARRIPVDHMNGRHAISGLQEGGAYRVCLQYTMQSGSLSGTNDTSITSTIAPTASDTKMLCVDASTKLAHIPASIGSCLGAVLALLFVTGLVLVSRRANRRRKKAERQTSAKKAAMETVTMSQQQQHQGGANSSVTSATSSATRDDRASSANGDEQEQAEDEDLEERQNPSAISETEHVELGLAPPPLPPPPPGLATPSFCEVEEPQSDSPSQRPQVPIQLMPQSVSLPLTHLQSQPQQQISHTHSQGTGEALWNDDQVTVVISGGRQVIQVNQTDEYTIDLRHCRNESGFERVVGSLQASLKKGSSSVAEDIAMVANERDGYDSDPEQSKSTRTALLYTQLIETL